jgi:uncharacterized protein (TIGR02646 family)
MRPVERGDAPQVFTNYRDAYPFLVQRLGDYCNYCERQIETHLAVEHVQPKSPVPALRNEWSNFLLGCANCNSSKGDTLVVLTDYLWPDSENTMSVFSYSEGGLVDHQDGLAPPLKAKALATITLVGLDKYPGNPGREPTSADVRWQRRLEAWQKAEWCQRLVAENDTEQVRSLVIEVAKGRGMYSIFWTVFHGDADIRKRLREAFAGTSHACFDANEELLPRPGGQI